jgi:hypothetical protein
MLVLVVHGPHGSKAISSQVSSTPLAARTMLSVGGFDCAGAKCKLHHPGWSTNGSIGLIERVDAVVAKLFGAIHRPCLGRPPAINYLQCAELLSRVIAGCAVPDQREPVMYFALEQPENCPHCGISMRSFVKLQNDFHRKPSDSPRLSVPIAQGFPSLKMPGLLLQGVPEW